MADPEAQELGLPAGIAKPYSSGHAPPAAPSAAKVLSHFHDVLCTYQEGCGRYCLKLRPLKEFFCFSVPRSDLRKRLQSNPVYFRINHEVIFLILVPVLDWKSAIIIWVLVLSWMFFLAVNNDPNWKLHICGLKLSMTKRWMVMAALTALALYVFHCGARLWCIIPLWLLIALAHSILHPVPAGGEAASIKDLIPEWAYAGAENAVCSGVCLAVPCCDRISPNISGCCCMPLVYDDVLCDFDHFFTEVVPHLHTGDIFLSSWPSKRGEWAETGRCMQRTRWTHVGMVYRPSDNTEILTSRDKIFKDGVCASRPLIMQMLVYGEMGFRDGHGFELVDLETWIKDFLDKFSHCAEPESEGQFIAGVRFLLDFERTNDFYKIVQSKVNEFWHKPYEEHDITMAAMDLCECIPGLSAMEMKSDDNSLFCSEMVAEVYKAVGLVKKNINTAEFIPKNFDSSSWLWLQGGARLSAEYIVKCAMTEEQRSATKYKNRGLRDPLSKDKFGIGGFWGVDASAKMRAGWGLPTAPSSSPELATVGSPELPPVQSAMSSPGAATPTADPGREPGQGTGSKDPLLSPSSAA